MRGPGKHESPSPCPLPRNCGAGAVGRKCVTRGEVAGERELIRSEVLKNHLNSRSSQVHETSTNAESLTFKKLRVFNKPQAASRRNLIRNRDILDFVSCIC